MNLLERIATFLWRDRGGYDPATGAMTQDYRRSLLTRWRDWRYRRRGTLLRAFPWLMPALIGAAAAFGAAFAPVYLSDKAHEQVDAHTGEFILQCVHHPDDIDILVCRRQR